MRISDWSSDVCSSDLYHLLTVSLAMGDLTGLTLASAATLLRAQELSPVDYVAACLKRIHQYDSGLNAFISTDDESALHRSEEHTSELQSLMRISYAVFCLKKKTNNTKYI